MPGPRMAEFAGLHARRARHRMAHGPLRSRMTMATNVEIYQRILETFNREVSTGSCPYFTDDVEVYDPDLPPGTYRGPRRSAASLELLMSGFDDVEIRDFRLLPAGDRVVALLHTRAKGERVDLEVETRDAHTDHLPRRQDRLLAALPRPGRGSHGRRPGPGARQPSQLGLLAAYASRVGSASDEASRSWPLWRSSSSRASAEVRWPSADTAGIGEEKVWPRDPYPSSRAIRRAQEFAAAAETSPSR